MRPLLALAALLLLAAPAQASFPGRNGDLVVAVDDGTCELGANLQRVTLKGTLTPLTSVCQGDSDDARDHYVGAPEAAPDGQSVLAFNDGKVVRVALDGTITPVPAEPAPYYDPTGFGDELSFFGDGASFTAGQHRYFLDGSPSQPLTVGNGHVSPDGKLRAVRRTKGTYLYSVATGKVVRRIAPAKAVDIDWSPDGRRLVYATRYFQREVKGGASGGNLFVVRRDGTHRRTLVHREDIAETQPTWSPDGRTVAWVSLGFSAGDVGFRVSPSLWKVSVRTGKRRRIRSLDRPFVEEGYFHAPELTWLSRP